MIELKPCPFCGGTDVRITQTIIGTRGWVTCEDCDASGPMAAGGTEIIIAKWNTRPGEDTLRAELERALKTMADATAALERWSSQWAWWDNPEDDAMMAEMEAMSTDELVAAIEASAGSRTDEELDA